MVRPLGRLRWRRARKLAAGLDLLAAVGPRYAIGRRRELRHLKRLDYELPNALYRSIWGEAATQLGARLLELGQGRFELRRDQTSCQVWLHRTTLDDPASVERALDKPQVQRLLGAAALPVPAHVAVRYDDPAAALGFLERKGGPVVVKPASSSGGIGVTMGVRTEDELIRAMLFASSTDSRLLIEHESPGDCYRFLFLDGELLDLVRRRPPKLVGDGRSTAAELIAAENRRRLAGVGREAFHLLLMNLDAVLTLERQGLDLSSRPQSGEAFLVKRVVSQNGSRDNETVRERLSPQLVAEAKAAVDAVGLRFAGVDLITDDLTRPLSASGGAILEVNGTPGLHYHYLVAEPAGATLVAVPILQAMLAPPRDAPVFLPPVAG